MTPARLAAPPGAEPIAVRGVELLADCTGVIYWPEERTLVVADLHLEKGSSYAERGILLPPYDTAATLARLSVAAARYAPRRVIALGDSFHDRRGPMRLASNDRDTLADLQRGRDWIWITGNHDPVPAEGIGGGFAAALTCAALVFRHEPSKEPAAGEICGHLHPVAKVSHRGQTVSRRCFASDGQRVVMPAFGAFTGGLNVLHHAFSEVFGTRQFTAYVLGQRRLYAVGSRRMADR